MTRTSYCILLGGSWVVLSRLMSPLIWVISVTTLVITPFYKLPLNLQVHPIQALLRAIADYTLTPNPQP